MSISDQKADEMVAIVGGMGGGVFLRNMVRALSMHSWLNSEDQNARLAAGKWALAHPKAYAAAKQRAVEARHERRMGRA